MSLLETYRGNGVQFRYPEFWELSEQRDDHQISISVASPGTSFWSLSLFFGRPAPGDLMDSAVQAFREEYDEMDVYPAAGRLGPYACEGRDVQFVCLELINGASLRALQAGDVTAFVLYQGTDQELEETRPILEAISSSLRLDGTGETDDPGGAFDFASSP